MENTSFYTEKLDRVDIKGFNFISSLTQGRINMRTLFIILLSVFFTGCQSDEKAASQDLTQTGNPPIKPDTMLPVP